MRACENSSRLQVPSSKNEVACDKYRNLQRFEGPNSPNGATQWTVRIRVAGKRLAKTFADAKFEGETPEERKITALFHALQWRDEKLAEVEPIREKRVKAKKAKPTPESTLRRLRGTGIRRRDNAQGRGWDLRMCYHKQTICKYFADDIYGSAEKAFRAACAEKHRIRMNPPPRKREAGIDEIISNAIGRVRQMTYHVTTKGGKHE